MKFYWCNFLLNRVVDVLSFFFLPTILLLKQSLKHFTLKKFTLKN